MPRPIPVGDELSKPFWDACNERRLVVQNCTACNRLQHPPEAVCRQCGSADKLEWRQMSGRGRIAGQVVVYDSRQRLWWPDQPYNVASVKLDEDPAIIFLTNLPGTPVDGVAVGSTVQVDFLEVAPGRLIPEWRVS